MTPRGSARQTLAWYRQPLVWMLIVIPGSAVIGGIITIYLAVASNDGLVEDDYYWQGKQINRLLERDQRAEAMGLAGRLLLQDEGGVELRLVSATANPVWPDSLELKLRNATRKGLDQMVTLTRITDAVYRAPGMIIEVGKWYLELGTAEWRLTGILWRPGGGEVNLKAGARF